MRVPPKNKHLLIPLTSLDCSFIVTLPSMILESDVFVQLLVISYMHEITREGVL